MARTKQKEVYGSGSVSPEKRNGVVVRDCWRVCISLGVEEYTDKNGKQRKRRRKVQRTVHGSLADARKVCKQLVDEYADIDPQSAGMTFGDACEAWATSMRNANTCSAAKLKDYETMMGQVAYQLGSKTIAEIKKQDVESALASVKSQRNLSQRRHREMFQTVKRVFEYCIDSDWLVRNPCRGLKTPRVTQEVDRRSLTPEECARLRACIDRDELAAYEDFDAKEQRQREWDRTRTNGKTFSRSKLFGLSQISGIIAVRLMLATGMRRGEALGLQWENVDFESSQITVCKSLNAQMVHKTTKTKKGIRTLYVDADTMAHLAKWKAFQGKALHLVMLEAPDGRKRSAKQTGKTSVCCNCSGGFLEPRTFARWWGDKDNKGYRDSIGFPDLVPHELRHTQATLLLGNGVDVKTVQTRLGHASSSLTLDIYGHAIPANDRNAAELMGSIYNAAAEPSAKVVKVNRQTA